MGNQKRKPARTGEKQPEARKCLIGARFRASMSHTRNEIAQHRQPVNPLSQRPAPIRAHK